MVTRHGRGIYWLAIGLILSVLPHSQRIPIWITFLLPIFFISKFYFPAISHIKGRILLAFKAAMLVLVLFVMVGLHTHFGNVFGLKPGVSLLVLLAALKFIEINQQRDLYVSCFLGYFLVVTNFLYTQTIATALYMILIIFIMTVSLVFFNDTRKELSYKVPVKTALALLLQSVPVMLVLFILFPRISGPLWGLPNDAHTGLVGIDDEMSPGSISQLVQNDQVAFRVDFNSAQPQQKQLYWRGPVLTHTNGYRWVRGEIAYDAARIASTALEPVSYTVTLEPHNQLWIYALEIPGKETEQSKMTADFQLLTQKPVTGRLRYDMISYPDYQITELKDSELRVNLLLPERLHSQTRSLVTQWINEGLSKQQLVDRALELFSEEDFYYTLKPPLLNKDRVDQFLFETRQGFCEHYASAFVVMMRAAGIPARVVLGYQGGEYNPIGDYLIVHQRNAHAWTEIWLDDQGWLRVDPTAVISPLRVIEGIESVLPESDLNIIPLVFSGNSLARDLWRQFRYRWDAANNKWNQWVISYGPDRQKNFLAQLGMQDIDWGGMALLIAVFISLIILYMAFILFRQPPHSKKDTVKFLYDQFCKKLSHRGGIHRAVHEGPVDFCRRAVIKRHDLSKQIKLITDIYIAVRYGSDNSKIDILRRHIKALRV